MNPTLDVRTRALVMARTFGMVAVSVLLSRPASVSAQVAILSGNVESDGSTPPTEGWYPNRDHPVYDPHPTVFSVPNIATIDYPLGTQLKSSSTNFEVHLSPGSNLKLGVFNHLPGKLLTNGNMGSPSAVYVLAPYFMASRQVSCSTTTCSGMESVKLYSKWGNVKGTATLDDGTPFPIPISISAVRKDVAPVDEVLYFPPRDALTNNEDGSYTFATGYLGPDRDNSTCFYPFVGNQCFPIPYDVTKNHWGLRVRGDGALDGTDHVHASNGPGALTYTIAAGPHAVDVSVASNQDSTKNFTLSWDEYIDTLEDQIENRPDDDCTSGGGSDGGGIAAAPHPVSLITGNVFLDQTDVVLPGLREDLVFTRSYNSLSGPAGAFGKGWNHSFEKHLEVLSPYILRLRDSNGAPRYFTDPNKDGIFTPYGAINPESTMVHTAAGYSRTYRTGGGEEYRPDGRLKSQTDRTGRTTNLVYDGQNRIAEIVTPEGRKLTLDYGNSINEIWRIIGPEGVIAEYRYRNQGNYQNHAMLLTEVTYADQTGFRFTYNDDFQLTTVSDLGGVVLDRHGYVNKLAAWSEKNGGQERHTFKYDPGRTTVTNGAGAWSIFEWTRKRAGRFITKVTGCGFCGSSSGMTIIERDEEGRVTRYVDADGRATVYTYAGANLASITNNLQRTTTFGNYDEFGRPRSITVSGMGTTLLTYVLEGVKTIRTPGGQTTTLTYVDGRLQSVQSPGGLHYTFDISDFGELRSITDPRGKTTTFGYDLMGRTTSVTRPGNLTTTIIRDGGGRPREIRRPDGKATRLTYGASGELKTVTDETGRASTYAYDGYQRPTGGVDPAGRPTRTAYDLMSRVTSVTDAKGQTTTYEYDDVGRVVKMTDPMSGFEEYTYYPSGLLHTRKDRKNVTTTYAYDPIGRLASKTYSDGTPPFGIVYDDDARTVTLSNASDTVTLTYDTSGRLVSEASAFNGSTVSSTYNDDNQPESVSLDGVQVAHYGYVSGYLDAIQFAGGNIGFAYDDLGRRRQMTYPNGVQTTYTYHATLGWLERIQAMAGTNVITDFRYTHDDVGNRTSKATPEWNESYSYDLASQLTGAERTGASTGTWRFGYDSVGNRRSEQAGGIPRSYDYDARNRLLDSAPSGPLRVAGQTSEPATVSVNGHPARMLPGNTFETEVPAETAATGLSVSAQDLSTNVRTTVYQVPALAGPVTYTHDPNGNLTQRSDDTGSWTYEWNANNQLLRVTKDGTEAARFQYDPLGRRIQKVAGSVTMGYLYNGMDILRESRSDSGVFTYTHGPGIDEPLARRDTSGAVEYYHADGLGSIVKMTNQTGTVVQARQYDAWGKLDVGADQPGYAYTGREWDPETGLYYYRARYYDPKVGRLLSEDPIGFRGGLNFYGYVSNSPIMYRDPAGLWSPQGHDKIYDNSFQGRLYQRDIDIMKKEGRDFDRRSQGKQEAYKHSMSEPGEDPAQALRRRDDFIRKKINAGREAARRGDRTRALQCLAQAAHPSMDSSSSHHTGPNGDPEPWDPKNPFGHSPGFAGDLFIGGERKRDLTPEILASQKQILNDLYNQIFEY